MKTKSSNIKPYETITIQEKNFEIKHQKFVTRYRTFIDKHGFRNSMADIEMLPTRLFFTPSIINEKDDKDQIDVISNEYLITIKEYLEELQVDIDKLIKEK